MFMDSATYFQVPLAAFKIKPPRSTGILPNPGMFEANGRPTVKIEFDPSQQALDFIVDNYVFDTVLSRAQYKNLARAIGSDSYSWKILLDRYQTTDSAKIFLRLFSPNVLETLPNLDPLGEEQSLKLAYIFYSTGTLPKIGTEDNPILKNLGMYSNVDYLCRARVHHWIDRGVQNLSVDKVSTLEKTIDDIRSRSNALSNEEIIEFNSTVILVVIKKLASALISEEDAQKLLALARSSTKDLEQSKILDEEQIRELQNDFQDELDTLSTIEQTDVQRNAQHAMQESVLLFGTENHAGLRIF